MGIILFLFIAFCVAYSVGLFDGGSNGGGYA